MTNSSYSQTVRDSLKTQLPDLTDAFLQSYTVLALVKGSETTLSDVHDAWSTVRVIDRPDHPDLVPFEQLTPEVQEYDRPFMDAIHVAASLINR